jgi:hypothetical protein
MWVRVLKGVLKGDRFPDTPLTFICISSLIGGLPSQLGRWTSSVPPYM